MTSGKNTTLVIVAVAIAVMLGATIGITMVSTHADAAKLRVHGKGNACERTADHTHHPNFCLLQRKE
jgi:CDP-diacylglycerol pyrophosphatase